MSPAEVLAATREVLAERGWHQGNFMDADTGAVCIVGALDAVVPEGVGDDVIVPLRDAIGVPCGLQITQWNDAPERTYEDVVLALKHAEELALERAS